MIGGLCGREEKWVNKRSVKIIEGALRTTNGCEKSNS